MDLFHEVGVHVYVKLLTLTLLRICNFNLYVTQFHINGIDRVEFDIGLERDGNQ